MPVKKNTTCKEFTAKGTKCKSFCAKGYDVCTLHLKSGKTLAYVRSGAKRTPAKKLGNVKIVDSDDSDEDVIEIVDSSDESSDSDVVDSSDSSDSDSEDSDDDLVKLMKKSTVSKRTTRARARGKPQCMCYDNDKRCVREVADDQLFFCYVHAKDPCMDAIENLNPQTTKEIERRRKAKPGFAAREDKDGLVRSMDNGKEVVGNPDFCCGKKHKGKCDYNICGDNGQQNPIKYAQALKQAKKDGNKKMVKKLKTQDTCEGCGKTVAVMTDYKGRNGEMMRKTTAIRNGKRGTVTRSWAEAGIKSEA